MLLTNTLVWLPVMFAKHRGVDLRSVSFPFLNRIPASNQTSLNTLAEKKRYHINTRCVIVNIMCRSGINDRLFSYIYIYKKLTFFFLFTSRHYFRDRVLTFGSMEIPCQITSQSETARFCFYKGFSFCFPSINRNARRNKIDLEAVI